jgi:DNA-binding NtrC family response regulator
MISPDIKLWLVRLLQKSWTSEQVSMISIIDDDRSVREAVKSLIRSLGYEAVTFASAATDRRWLP